MILFQNSIDVYLLYSVVLVKNNRDFNLEGLVLPTKPFRKVLRQFTGETPTNSPTQENDLVLSLL